MIELERVSCRKMITGAALSLLVLLSGCSFHSNQWDTLKRLLRPTETAIQDRWFLLGSTSNIRVYPVQASGAIIFTDGEEVFLKFDGWHFVEIRGLPGPYPEKKSEKPVVIAFDYFVTDSFNQKGAEEKNLSRQQSLSFGESEKIVYEVRCAAWQRMSDFEGVLLSQSCLFDSQESFTNSIWLDQSGNIRAVESVLGPRGDKIRVEVRNL